MIRKQTTVLRHRGDLPRWTVPPHLRGRACQICGFFFQDAESHGTLDLATGELTCQTRTIRVTNRPSRALVRAS